MALDLKKNNYKELLNHIGHEIECVCYGNSEEPENVAIECNTCHVVLMDYNHPDLEEEIDE